MRISLLLVLFGSAAFAGTPEALRALHDGDPAAACALFEEASREAPEDADLFASWGVALLELEEWERAGEVLRVSLRLRPEADVAFNLAIAELGAGRAEAAWGAASLALRWAGEGRLRERAADVGLAAARRMESREAREAAFEEIAAWAPGTAAGREAQAELE